MDHPLCRQIESRGNARLTRGTTTQQTTSSQQFWTSSTMYGPIHATATQERAICRIDYGIHLKPCNIPLHYLYPGHVINHYK